MAYRFDPYDSSLVIEGFQNGIADDPFTGIADMRNVNIISVPNEASVNFKTSAATVTISTSFSVTSADAGTDVFTVSSGTGLEGGMAITFTTTPSVSSTPSLSMGTPYWMDANTPTTFKLYSDFERANIINVTGTGTGTFTVVNPGGGNQSGVQQGIKYIVSDSRLGNHYAVDDRGQVWTDKQLTLTSGFWTYTGNKVPDKTFTSGNGLVYYQASNGDGYLFVFHNSSIDYTRVDTAFNWQYQWNFTAGTVGSYSTTPTRILNSTAGYTGSHEALVGQDNTVYFCDLNFLGSFFEKPLQVFNPQTLSTYTPAAKALGLPVIDNANCLAELGTNLMVGGQRNLIYPWDRISTSFKYPIFLSENVVAKMVTVNTNTYIFVGNRGRIYITNGTQAQLYKKIPDHISGTVEPYFIWGGATFNKNQLYFSAKAVTNGGVALTTGTNAYGGVWAIDLDTRAIRLTNQLSYGTYAGYATAISNIIPIIGQSSQSPVNPSGVGIIIGWDSGATTYGIDISSSNPYTGSQAIIDSDLIPIGTFERPRNMTRVEYRLTKPMVSGESITIQQRLDFSLPWTTILTDSTAGHYSNSGPINFENAQWLQMRAVLNSTATNPSYTRLKEFRILGLAVQNG